MARRLAAVVLVLAVILAAQGSAADTPYEELDQVEADIKDLNRQIAAGKQQQSEVARELAAAEARLGVLRGEYDAATARLDAAVARVEAGEAELARISGILDTVARELAETRLAIIDQSEAVRERAAEMYMSQSFGLSGLLMEMDTVADAAVGWEYAGRAITDGEAMIRDLEALRAVEEEQQALLTEQEAAQAAVVVTLEGERVTLEAERAAVAATVAAAEDEMAGYAALLARVKAEIAEMDGEIAALEEDAKKLEQEIIALQSKEGERPGALAWPVDGYVSSAFGYRTHPISGRKRLHTGIDIGALGGTPIHAANRGTVIFSGWYGGYGNAIVIDHGGGLTTLYAHQSRLRVGVGDKVALGDRIGDVGSTGYSTGAHLHFETRENGVPVDPMKYLGG